MLKTVEEYNEDVEKADKILSDVLEYREDVDSIIEDFKSFNDNPKFEEIKAGQRVPSVPTNAMIYANKLVKAGLPSMTTLEVYYLLRKYNEDA